MKRNNITLVSTVTITALAVFLLAFCINRVVAQETEYHGINRPEFERPLVIDKKLEKQVTDLQKRVTALEKTVAELQKKIKSPSKKK